MKFSCEKAMLQTACTVASRAVASKSPIPAVEGILLEAGACLRVTGYDLKKAIYTDSEAVVDQPGSIVLNSRLFGEIIRRLPDGTVTIASDENNAVSLKCGKISYNIMGMDPSDYPELPRMNENNSFSLPQEKLKKMINQTIFAISTNDMRPIYTGTLFDVENDTLTMVSIDGYRLAKRVEKLAETNTEKCSFVVPGNTLSDVEKICADSEEPVKISVGDKHISFFIGSTVVISRRLEGEFLNYKKSIPENFRYTMKIEKSDLMRTVDRVSLIITEKSNIPVRLKFGDGSILCSCATVIGNAEDLCLCEGSGDNLEIGFNDKYITEALKNAPVDNILFCVNTSNSPCVIKAGDGTESFTYMILPVRLRAGE
ncbi:MAG: DNA polymerase III subunit beta [Oscillospiraceae bacterium]|nr:DNA polymerase III subunit beta [Oscillospiraceae bacterium]